MRIVAIDPGVGGAFAILDTSVVAIQTCLMPDGMTGIVDRLRVLKTDDAGYAYMEKVGCYMPGNSGPASVKFARHCGVLETALYCTGWPTTMVLPNTWMKFLGTMPKEKMDRKRFIKEMMQRRFPQLKVTLTNADALGLLVFAAAQKGVRI